MGYGDFAVLMTALFDIGNLVFNLNAAGACFDHLFGQQVGCFLVAKPCIDVRYNRHHMGLKMINFVSNVFFLDIVSISQRFIQFLEKMPQFTGISLLEKAIQLLDQFRNRGFFMDRLIG